MFAPSRAGSSLAPATIFARSSSAASPRVPLRGPGPSRHAANACPGHHNQVSFEVSPFWPGVARGVVGGAEAGSSEPPQLGSGKGCGGWGGQHGGLSIRFSEPWFTLSSRPVLPGAERCGATGGVFGVLGAVYPVGCWLVSGPRVGGGSFSGAETAGCVELPDGTCWVRTPPCGGLWGGGGAVERACPPIWSRKLVSIARSGGQRWQSAENQTSFGAQLRAFRGHCRRRKRGGQ